VVIAPLPAATSPLVCSGTATTA